MKVRIIASVCLAPGRDVFVGDVLDLGEDEARRLIRDRWAVEHDPRTAEPIVAEPGEVIDLDPAVEHHDPQLRPKGSGKKEK